MPKRVLILAGGIISFVVVFFTMALAMGLMRAGPGAFFSALAGHAPAATAGVKASAPESAGSAKVDEPSAPASAPAPSTASAPAPAEAPANAAANPATAGGAAPGEDPLVSRAEALTRIEDALQKRQTQMDEEKKRLAALQKELESTGTHLDSLEKEAAGHLARVYGSMKPEAAAEILMRLPLDLQTSIIGGMEEKSAAKVLAAMNPSVAARVSQKLGARRP